MPLRDELNGFLRLQKTFFGIPPPTSGDPDVGILGVPYDITSSYLPGCRFGPDEVRRATDSMFCHSYPLKLGMTQYSKEKSLAERMTLEDIGDLEIELRLPEAAFHDISDAAYRLSKRATSIVFIGGDHFITYPLMRGVKRATGSKYGIVWLDSHADFYPDFGGYKLSHATGLRRIVSDGIVDIQNVIGYDLRAAIPDQLEELAGGEELILPTMSSTLSKIEAVASRVESIYLSIDLDVMRPELVPGVSHPELGGLSVDEIIKVLRACFGTGKITYVDIVELNPMLDRTGLAAVMARDLLREVLTGFVRQKDI